MGTKAGSDLKNKAIGGTTWSNKEQDDQNRLHVQADYSCKPEPPNPPPLVTECYHLHAILYLYAII